MAIDEARLQKFLTNRRGPVWAVVERKAEGVRERAFENVSGRFLNRDTGRLRDGYGGNKGLHVEMKVVDGDVVARIGSDAVSPPGKNSAGGESYPGFWNATSRPWLDTALRDEFIYGR